MKFITGLKEKAKKWFDVSSKWLSSKLKENRGSGIIGWIEAGLLVLLAVAACIAAVALVSAIVVFCLSIPGLLFGSILWAAWTWAGLGAELFPQLDPHWLTLNWGQFFWIVTIVYYVGRLLGIRKKSGAGLAQPKS